MEEWRGEAVWQKVPCVRCGTKHPSHCPDCPNDPPCADHVCSWPEELQGETARQVARHLESGPVDIRHLVRRPGRREKTVRWLRRTFTRSRCGCPCRTCRTYCGACAQWCGRL